MTYIISDIHGCFDEFCELLSKIHFSDEDELFILGDVVDRGEAPIAVLQDIMERPNVFLIKGNHEVMAMNVLKRLCIEVENESINELRQEDIVTLYDWMANGGQNTINQFRELSRGEQEDMLGYLEESSDYEIVEIGDKKYILVHGGLENFSPDREISDYYIDELVCPRPDYGRRYFADENTVLVTGHTPTPLIRSDQKDLVFAENGHLAIDCGCVFGGSLAAVCLENGEVTYVKKKSR
ncbi:MAG: fructose-bisphosphatase class III [Clostridia bacterium]|nr:fructose-bisphosphatase class III [Clostridia bacterium]